MEKKTNILFAVLLIISVIAMVFSSQIRESALFPLLRAPVYPFVTAIMNISKAIEADISYKLILDRYADMAIKNTLSKGIENENRTLRAMLDLAEKSQYDLVPAEIIGAEFLENSRIIINKGKLAGLSKQMPVIFLNGLVGKIVEVHELTSIVETYNNMNFRVGVRDKNNLFYSIAKYHSTEKLEVINLQTDVSLNINDTLYTSGLGELFPDGLTVGVITDIKDNNDGEAVYIIKPFEQLHALKFVFIILKQPSISLRAENEKYSDEGRIGWFTVMRRKL